MGAAVDLHFWPTPNGWKISIMLEETGLPYRLVSVDIGQGEQHQPAFLDLSPNGRMPALFDPEVRTASPTAHREAETAKAHRG